jgi:heme-degrading monooxygenase HmoA
VRPTDVETVPHENDERVRACSDAVRARAVGRVRCERCLLYARVTTTTLAPDEPDAAEAVFRQVLPTIQALPGFSGMFIASEMGGRRILALSLWTSLGALEAAEPVMENLKQAESKHRHIEAQETAHFRVSAGKLAM